MLVMEHHTLFNDPVVLAFQVRALGGSCNINLIELKWPMYMIDALQEET